MAFTRSSVGPTCLFMSRHWPFLLRLILFALAPGPCCALALYSLISFSFSSFPLVLFFFLFPGIGTKEPSRFTQSLNVLQDTVSSKSQIL